MRVAIYSRISRDTAGEGLGVQRQVDACRQLAALRGWEVDESHVYNENDRSAYDGRLRPEFEALKVALAAGQVDGVVSWHLDRLTRRLRDLEDLIDIGKPIATVHAGDIDLSSPMGQAIARVVGVIGQMESAVKAERSRAKHKQLAESGAWASGRCFGYTKDGEIIPSEAEVIQEIARRLLSDESLRSVTAWLGKNNIPTVKGGTWRVSTVKQMITAARLSGQREWTPRSSGKRGYGMGEIIGDGAWKPILSKEETNSLRKLFLARAGTRGRPVQRLLSGGIAFCARCGRPLQAAKDERQGRRYACIAVPGNGRCGKISVLAEPLETYVTDAVLVALEGAAFAAPATPDTAPLSREVIRLSAEMDAVADDFVAQRITRHEWIRVRDGLAVRRAEAERALSDALTAPTLEGLPDTSEALAAAWPDFDLERRRRVLVALLDGVLVGGAAVRGRPRFDSDRVRLVWRA